MIKKQKEKYTGSIYTMCGTLVDHEENRQEMYRYESILAKLGIPIFLPINKVTDDMNDNVLSYIHREKIKASDGIIVIIPEDDYIGNKTRKEIEYARELNLEIYYNKIPDVWDSDLFDYKKLDVDILGFDLYKEIERK